MDFRRMIAAVCVGASATICAASSLDNGVVAYWNFNEGTGATAADLSGNSHTGTLSGATWSASGKNEKAASFTYSIGGTQHVDCGNFNIGGNAMTISAWVKPSTFGQDDGRIISKASGTGLTAHDWMVSTITSGGPGHIRLRLTTSTTSTITFITKSGALDLNAWNHVAVTYDGSHFYIYKNGTSIGDSALSGNLPTTGNSVYIGNSPGTYPTDARPWDGLIDEVIIYSRALSSSEITDLAHDSLPTLGKTPVVITVAHFSVLVSNLQAKANAGKVDFMVNPQAGNYALSLMDLTGRTLWNYTGSAQNISCNVPVHQTYVAVLKQGNEKTVQKFAVSR